MILKPTEQQMMHELKIDLPGYTIAAQCYGDNKLPILLAFHGWLDNAQSFALLAPLLAKNFHVIAIDLPGHGRSSHVAAGGHYHFFDAIFTAAALMNNLSDKPIHLLGHSLGACLVSLLGGVIPERIRSIALIEALGPFSAPAQTCPEQLHQYIHTVIDRNKIRSSAYPTFEHAIAARSKAGHLAPQLAALLASRGVSEQDGKFYWSHDRRLLATSPIRMTEEQVLACLKNISCPVLFIKADQGMRMEAEILANREKSIKNLDIKTTAGGHHVHMEKPEAVAELLVKFYKDLI